LRCTPLHRDLYFAVDWYLAEAGKAVAVRFVDEFEHIKALISENPHLGAPGKAGSRRLIFRHFPYTWSTEFAVRLSSFWRSRTTAVCLTIGPGGCETTRRPV
jgi:plasmid stabilization system protein ParE